MLRAERLLALVQTLRERRTPITARTLAVRFGVSERTIYRDVEVLTGLGAPIRGEPGLGFVLGPGFFLPPLSLTETEADAVVLGLRFVAKRGDAGLVSAASAALAKIQAGVSGETERAMRANGLTVGPSGTGDTKWVEAVREALGQERKLLIGYCNEKGDASERTVWPVALGFFARVDVIAAWCESRRAFRHFRLDRVRRLVALSAPLPTPRRILLARYRMEEPLADV